jgi:hypothetical protein
MHFESADEVARWCAQMRKESRGKAVEALEMRRSL